MVVRVYADNSLIYTIDSPKPFYEKTPGAVWNFVEIPSDTEKVTVILQAVYPEVRQKAIISTLGIWSRCTTRSYMVQDWILL